MLNPKIVSRPRAQALRLRGRPARPAVRHLRRRRLRRSSSTTTTSLTYESIARVSKKDADAMAGFEAIMGRAAEFLRPLMMRPPPALGSKHPRDVASLLREAGRAAGLGAQRPARAVPRDDDVGRRPARRLLRDGRAQGRLREHRRRRRVGRPAHARAPRTTCSTTTSARSTASPAPGATCAAGWAASARRSRRAPARPAPTSARTPTVASIDVRDGVVTGVTLSDGESCTRRPSCPARTRAARCSTSSAASTSPRRSPRRCAATRPAAGP